MKVNIRYTVDLQDVLEEMSTLYCKSLSKLNASLDIYNHFLKHGFKESDVEHIIKALEHNVESYHDHQTRTAEILNILQGYKNIKDGSVQPPEPEEIVKQSE